MFQHMGVARGGATAALASCLPTAWDWAGLCHGRSSGIGRGFDCVERARSRPPPAARLEETAVQVDWTGRIISLVPRGCGGCGGSAGFQPRAVGVAKVDRPRH